MFVTREQITETQHTQTAQEAVWRALMPYLCQGCGSAQADAQRHIESMLSKQSERVQDTLGLCESPIERLMLISLAHIPLRQDGGQLPAICDLLHDPFMDTSKLCIAPQFTLGRYRMDFYVQWGWDEKTGHAERMCAECDGKEYHGADQWAPDRIREGFMASFGVHTVRFTGAEIYRAQGLISQNISCLTELCGEVWREVA